MNTGYPAPYPQGYPPGPATQVPQQPQAPQAARQPPYPVRQPSAQPSGQPNGTAPSGPSPQNAGGSRGPRNNSVHSATASLETVERALGDLRVSQATANGLPTRGGRRGGRGQEAKASDLRVPDTDFDFQSSNARFDKSAISPRGTPKIDGEGQADDDKSGEKEEPAYNPKKSFFDSLSSGSNGPGADTRGGRGGRRGGGRNRREEERERNVATFGEPGGVGLMGPGQYVGGWGGFGRRGGGRGRRGAAIAGAAR